MRRQDRAMTKMEEILQVIDQCKVCRIAMNDEGRLYIIPMNYGYTWENDRLTLYFHGARTGQKLDILAKNPEVAFEMDCNHNLVEAEMPCAYSFEYASIIGNGHAEILETHEEKALALNEIMKHQSGRSFTFRENETASVAVFAITADSFTGKHRTMD